MVVIVRKVSPLTGEMNEMAFPYSMIEFEDRLTRWKEGLIQDVFVELDAGQREFLMTGHTPEDWAKLSAPQECD